MDFDNLPTVIVIVGSRDFPKISWVDKFVQKLPSTKIIVSGGARGVDKAAKAAADKYGHHYKPYHVEDFEWKLLGRTVGRFRNEQIVQYAARWGGVVIIFMIDSPGSTHVKECCEKYNVPYTVYTP